MINDLCKELRAKNIGGSEIAALFGESPYLSEFKLWQIKRGGIEGDDLDENERIQSGNFLEGGTIAWANQKWGYQFYQPHEYVEHPNVVGMGCTPDAFCRQDPEIMAQVKIVDSLQFALHWKANGDKIEEAPLHIILQVQHEMEVCRKNHNVLIVLVGGNRIYEMICDYDAQTGSILRKKVLKFWLSTQPPEPDFSRDLPTIKEIRSRLPVKKFEDCSEDDYLYNLLKIAKAAQVTANRCRDTSQCTQAEILHYIGNSQSIRCKDIVLDVVNKGSLRITMEEILL